jgi:ribosomal protein L16 Arg81 hydroxylase
MDIARLLSPTNLADFARKWNRESFKFVGRSDRFADVAFDLEKLKAALRDRAHAVKAQYIDAIAGHTEIAIDPGEIDNHFAKGMTICVQDIDKLLPELASQSVTLRRSMNFPGIINFSCYWSPESGGFALHCDDHPVFIWQLAGKKKWYYSPTSSVGRTFGSIVYSDERLRALHKVSGWIQAGVAQGQGGFLSNKA